MDPKFAGMQQQLVIRLVVCADLFTLFTDRRSVAEMAGRLGSIARLRSLDVKACAMLSLSQSVRRLHIQRISQAVATPWLKCSTCPSTFFVSCSGIPSLAFVLAVRAPGKAGAPGFQDAPGEGARSSSHQSSRDPSPHSWHFLGL